MRPHQLFGNAPNHSLVASCLKAAAVVVVALCLVAQADVAPSRASTECGTCNADIEFYALTGWPTVHRDGRNSDFAPFVTSTARVVDWEALDGAAVLLAPSIGPDGTLYVTTGQGMGTSHLHAFSPNGELLWESPPQDSLEDLDSGAVGSAPVIDEAGDVYVADANQFWAFNPDGTKKWVADLPGEQSGMASAIITKQGHVGGITLNGQVVLFNRTDGSLAVPVLDLPGGPGAPGVDTLPGIWENGLMDPEIIPTVLNAFLGRKFEVVNTPAVHPVTGRIYITASGSTENEGALYAIDVGEQALTIAFEASMGNGSGTSPAISPDGAVVYAVSGDRMLQAFDAETGTLLWETEGVEAASSPSVAADGTIIVGNGSKGRPGRVMAFGSDGTEKWTAEFDDLAAGVLRPVGSWSPIIETGMPTGKANSVLSITPKCVWLGISLGYDASISGAPSHVPARSALVALDLEDGSIVDLTHVRDSFEGTISIGNDGRMYCSHAAFLSSIFQYGLRPLLPLTLRKHEARPAGITATRPLNDVDQCCRGVDWALELVQGARDAINDEDCAAVHSMLCWATSQLEGTQAVAWQHALGELGPERTELASALIGEAADHLVAAADGSGPDTLGIDEELEQAESALIAAKGALTEVVQVDVLPGVCPNEFSSVGLKSRVLEVALVGSDAFAPASVDPSTLRLSRADGVGGKISPYLSRRRATAVSADVTSPRPDWTYDCGDSQEDGIPDLVVGFSYRTMVEQFRLHALAAGDTIRLRVTGELTDGTPFSASDCITLGGSRFRR